MLGMLRSGLDADVSEVDADGGYELCNASVVIIPDALNAPRSLIPSIDRYLRQGGRLITLGGPPFCRDDIKNAVVGIENTVTAQPCGEKPVAALPVEIIPADIPPIETIPADMPDYFIEGLLPEYKYYPIANGVRAVAYEEQAVVAARDYKLPAAPVSVHPRPQGAGFDNMRDFRFIPLIEVYSEKGFRSGFLAWMIVNAAAKPERGPYDGSMLAGFGSNETEFFDAAGLAAVVDATRAMLGGCMLIEGGADEFIYAEDEIKEINIGFRIACINPDGYSVDLELASGGEIMLRKEYCVESLAEDSSSPNEQHCSENITAPGGINNSDVQNGPECGNEPCETKYISLSGSVYNAIGASFAHALSDGKPDKVVVTLKRGETIVDRIAQQVEYWRPAPVNEREYVTASDNEFMLRGKPLRLFGLNYMPSCGSAVNKEHNDNFHYYTQNAAYDPYMIYNDLLQVKDIGLNAVSLFIFHETAVAGNNMIHLIKMCEKLGIYVDLSIRPTADPFMFDEDQVKDMIISQHLPELTNVVAIDIAWERYLGNYEGSYGNRRGRKAFDADWEDWINGCYGSVENAESIWQCPVPRINGRVAGVTDDMLRAEAVTPDASVGTSRKEAGSDNASDDTQRLKTCTIDTPDGMPRCGCRKLVAAYRRFADDLVSLKHSQAADYIRTLDPNHLVSVRTGAQGGIPEADPADMGYDYQALAAGLDFMSPESYAIEHTEESAWQVAFTNALSRYVKPGAPVVWKECGWYVWNGSNFNRSAEKEKIQENLYRLLLDKMIAGHTAGVYFWFWPGGYRTDEKSDFGIINPDGSDRPVTALLRKYSKLFCNQPRLTGESEYRAVVDRDFYPDGIRGMYRAVRDEMIAAVSSRKTFALTDLSAGTDTATVPGAAIGGIPATVPGAAIGGVASTGVDLTSGCVGTGDGVLNIARTSTGGGEAGEYNPARYVNGEFRSVQVKAQDGSRIPVTNGGIVALSRGAPLNLQITMCNTLRATWLPGFTSDASSGEPGVSHGDSNCIRGCATDASSGVPGVSPDSFGENDSCAAYGGVCLQSTAASDIEFNLPLSRAVPYLATHTQEFSLSDSLGDDITVYFRLSINGRFPFGSRFGLRVRISE